MRAPLFAVLAAFLTTQAFAQSDKETINPVNWVLRIPDEIAPALGPYVACVRAMRGFPTNGQTEAGASEPPQATDCAKLRGEAYRQAEELLAALNAKGVAHSVNVSSTFNEIDRFVASLPDASSGKDSSEGAIPVAEAIMMEDEVHPYYARYRACLRNKVRGVPLMPDTIVKTFEDALAACRPERNSASSSAEAALAPRITDADERKRSVGETFNQADSTWLRLASRAREIILRRKAIATSETESKAQ